MRNNSGRDGRHLLGGAAAAMAMTLLAGCASGVSSYQAQTPGVFSVGYIDTKIDASHYAVIYTDYDKDRAQDYLQFHAAEVARKAGFAFFAFDTQGVAIERKTETHFDLNQLSNPGTSRNAGSAIPLNNYIPPTNNTNATLYYSAAGKISLLTAQQAQGNSKAIAVAPILAGTSPAARP